MSYNVIPVIIIATDLPHEIEAKYQPVRLNLEIKYGTEEPALKKKTREEAQKTTKVESVLLCRTQSLLWSEWSEKAAT